MAKYYVSVLLVRIVLPVSLLLCIALRPFGVSVLYLLLFFLAPLTPVPDSRTIDGWSGKFLLLNVLLSFLLLFTHVAWHTLLASTGTYGSLLVEYPIINVLGHNLGFVSYSSIDPLMAVHYMLPEIIMAAVSLLVYMVVKRLLTGPGVEEIKKIDTKYQEYPLVTSAGKYLCLILIMLSGIMRPSVTSGIYYLVFMGSATAWALGRPLSRGFAVVCRCLMAIMAVHVTVLLIYQCSYLTNLYSPNQNFARYFGLTKLVIINDTNPSLFTYEVTDDHMWATLASPFVILFTYFILAIETRQLFKPKVAISYINPKALSGEARETDPLIRVNSSKWSTQQSARQMRQDSTGSVVLHEEESAIEENEHTLMDDIVTAIIDFFQVLVRSSYIATTITMMAWSIMFHSWLTFVFLMWANIVWLCQDGRGFMLKTSPVLVVYAMLLLIAQYIYGMNLYESELPSNITEVNLRQIGLGRVEDGETCVPLLIKSLFTCMFWITLRQRIQDIRLRRQSAVIADMAAPLQLTASTAASVMDARREEENRSRLMRSLGEHLRALCARYWIYVVVIMLFVIGITGERMTIFRIIYMFLFLAFILMFQISWYWWRKTMYMFWVVVIVYSMINLILIYIYQFDNFSKLIEKYLLINESLQQDLGLEPYDPADLFVKLLTPTLFLTITIMQVHYFHKDFMALSDPKTRSNSLTANQPDSAKPSQDGASTMNNDVPPLPSEEANPRSQAATEADHSIEVSSINTVPRRRSLARKFSMSRTTRSPATEKVSAGVISIIKRAYHSSRKTAQEVIDRLFMYLDLHLIKIVFISLMLLCVMNVCAMHVPIMLMVAPALWFNAGKQRVCVLFISTLISIYFMAKMVYQIDYIKHNQFDVNCSSPFVFDNITSNMSLFNNAEWLGFKKATAEKPLVVVLKGYIGLLAVFTFYSLVYYRQQSLRASGKLPKERIKLIFPDVTRKEADDNLGQCLKYLINYGFYKFGVEITMICLMGVIGSRMDVYAVLYAGWLLVLVSIKRTAQSRLWPTFTACITFLVPVQYMIAVGFLPQFCVTYPWDSDDTQMKHIRSWMFLPYAEQPPHAYKLIFDFFLLLFATRQMKVFRIERTDGDQYPGGCNSEKIGSDWETPNFRNPVPDFLGYVGTWLDVVKRMVFLGMLWVTLAIMFMTGTNRVNLFSMGYLIGSFIFLWQGTDFYLRPKEAILKWWSWLVRYNVSVVVVKTLLQIPGCMFSAVMQEHACWLVQLLGIGCVDKFAGGNIARFIKMQYTKEAACSVPQEDIGLAWDGVCFAFLILQRRLFHSYYFYRVIDESKATTVLASRGAELIEELRQKQMKVQEDQETKILEKIKVKMERIKANQKKIQGAMAREPIHHDRVRDRPTYRPPASHQKAIRSGDYYMFDEFDDTDIHMKDDESSSDEDAPREMGIGKLRRKSSTQTQQPDAPLTEQDQEGPLTEMDEFAPLPAHEDTILDKIKQFGETAWAFISSLLVSLTRHLMKFSRDYRYVSKTLSVEKKILKEKEGFGIGIREGSQMIWEPLPETLAKHHNVTTLEEQDDSMFKQDRSPFVHLGYALWYAVLAHTDIVCYVMVFINQIQSATILSIPLPLMVFMWGTLTIPRPTKTFWVTLIAYTEVIVLIKSMFQFEILPWNQKVIPANMPFTAPRIIGIERKFNYALYDLLLLLIIFLHRFMLKSLGLWKESTPDIELREDMEYPLNDEDTQLVAEGHITEVGRKYVKLHDMTGP
uniref:Uncharacterized protein n=1 Tax=Heliothis virescens TaxID=7102 RepID=A0A2A4JQR7_HELVI